MTKLRKRLKISSQDLLWHKSDDHSEDIVGKMRKGPINLDMFGPRIILFPTLFNIIYEAIGHFSDNNRYKTKLGNWREKSVAHDILLVLSY